MNTARYRRARAIARSTAQDVPSTGGDQVKRASSRDPSIRSKDITNLAKEMRRYNLKLKDLKMAFLNVSVLN
jgi:hypothetical protein